MTLLGKYEIIKELGRGGFGIVYLARDEVLQREVALKVLHPTLVADSTFVTRFMQEARIAARLDHPNVVQVYDFGQEEGRYFLAMAYMPGGALKDLIKREGKLSPERALKMLKQVGEGLAYAHRKQVIHRDLKPGNILLDEDGDARISDLGFAKVLTGQASESLSASGAVIGTPAYIAPEVWRGQKAGTATDVYSLASILVEMVTGAPMFDGESTPEVMLKHFQPRQLPEDLPESWHQALLTAFDEDPEKRFKSVKAFMDALTHVEQQATQAPKASHVKPIPQEKHHAGFKEKEAGAVVEKDQSYPVDPGERTKVGQNVMPLNQGNVRLQPSRMGQPKKKWLLPGLLGLVALVLMVILVLLVQKNNTAKWAFYTQQTQSVTATFTRTNTPMQTNTPTPTKVLTPTRTSTITPTLTPTLGIGSTMIREKDGMGMVYVPEGTFTMGSTDSDAAYDESPVREVRLDAYWIDKYEVSNGQYQKCVNAGKCTKPRSTDSYTRSSYYGKAEYDNYPVIYVSWHQAKAYCEWAGGSLPTEAQWEKAARGTDARKYPWGDESPNSNLVNYGEIKGDTTAVGSYPRGASPYGAMDMAGNVWEWVLDWYGPYDAAETNNPQGPGTGDYRVLRGGGWYSSSGGIRSANRRYLNPTITGDYIGFRCVSSP